MTAASHAENVARGVAFLDARVGRDVWLPRIDLTTLNVRTSERCVVCQATGIPWYGSALDSLGVSLEIMHAEMGGLGSWTEAHGFGISLDRVQREDQRDWAGLTGEWHRRVTELRAAS